MGANCNDPQAGLEAFLQILEFALSIADRVAGSLETRTRSSRDSEKFVFECLYRADSSGEPEGSPVQEHPKYTITTPADGSWHSTDLLGFDADEEGDFVVVTEGTGLYEISDRIEVRT